MTRLSWRSLRLVQPWGLTASTIPSIVPTTIVNASLLPQGQVHERRGNRGPLAGRGSRGTSAPGSSLRLRSPRGDGGAHWHGDVRGDLQRRAAPSSNRRYARLRTDSRRT